MGRKPVGRFDSVFDSKIDGISKPRPSLTSSWRPELFVSGAEDDGGGGGVKPSPKLFRLKENPVASFY
jgi:hypothetical protein